MGAGLKYNNFKNLLVFPSGFLRRTSELPIRSDSFDEGEILNILKMERAVVQMT